MMDTKEVGDKVMAFLGEPEIISMLKEDHRKVEGLFKTFEQSRNKRQRKSLINQIVTELTVHARLEEEVVYPPIMRQEEDKAREAYEEHHVVKGLLSELSRMDGSEENVKAKVKVLSELVKHHVKEEEGELLPKLKDSGEDLDMMAETVKKRKMRMINSQAKKLSKAS
jgi:hemerythrin superfamily protein